MNYFIAGLRAFAINAEAQAAMSDINKGGEYLTVQDFKQLDNIIEGHSISDAIIDKPLIVRKTYSSPIINYGSDEQISTIWFLFCPRVGGIYSDVEDVKMGLWGEDTASLLVFLSSESEDYGVIELETGKESANLIHCDAAGPNGERINFRIIEEVLPSDFVLEQNYPNPFNAATSITFGLPTKTDWALEIFNINGQLMRSYSGNGDGHCLGWHGLRRPATCLRNLSLSSKGRRIYVFQKDDFA
jgi:hypothetical protein